MLPLLLSLLRPPSKQKHQQTLKSKPFKLKSGSFFIFPRQREGIDRHGTVNRKGTRELCRRDRRGRYKGAVEQLIGTEILGAVREGALGRAEESREALTGVGNPPDTQGVKNRVLQE